MHFQLPNISGIENISFRADVHRDIDVSTLPQIENVKLNDGTTPRSVNLSITLADGQSLHLVNLKDGNVNHSTIEKGGGVIITQPDGVTSLDLHIADVGPERSNVSENVIVDISNQRLTSFNLHVSNENSLTSKFRR